MTSLADGLDLAGKVFVPWTPKHALHVRSREQVQRTEPCLIRYWVYLACIFHVQVSTGALGAFRPNPPSITKLRPRPGLASCLKRTDKCLLNGLGVPNQKKDAIIVAYQPK
jgi:hypothetical protein